MEQLFNKSHSLLLFNLPIFRPFSSAHENPIRRVKLACSISRAALAHTSGDVIP